MSHFNWMLKAFVKRKTKILKATLLCLSTMKNYLAGTKLQLDSIKAMIDKEQELHLMTPTVSDLK